MEAEGLVPAIMTPLDLKKSEKWVVVGGGYGGLAFAARWSYLRKDLVKKKVRVPSLYMISSASHSDCTCELYRSLRRGVPEVFDLPAVLKNKPVEFKEARVLGIDPRAKKLSLRSEVKEEFSYDRLIMATGAGRLNQNLEGLEALIEHQNPLEPRIFHSRSNKQISGLRMALTRIKWAVKTNKKELFVVVIGGGATGVEIAGEIAAMRGQGASKRVIVVEASYDPLKSVLGIVGNKLLREQMKKMKLEYFEGAGARRVDAKHLFLENGQTIPWDLLVVAQGSLPDKKLFDEFGDIWTPSNQIRVARDFHIEDWSSHYAIGDLASYEWADQKLPKTAQVAAQQGFYLADRLAAELQGEDSQVPPFRWQNWGYLISLGPMNGSGKIGPLPLPVIWGPAVDLAKRGARIRFDAQVFSGLKLSP
jgi:NADH:ubiquinone reductase (H+-translocating)